MSALNASTTTDHDIGFTNVDTSNLRSPSLALNPTVAKMAECPSSLKLIRNPYAKVSPASSETSFVSSSAASMVNPYATKTLKRRLEQAETEKTKKFVGGSERARQLARKKAWKQGGTRIAVPSQSDNTQNDYLPTRMHISERFFAALLRSSPKEFLESEGTTTKANELWEAICKRVGLEVPTGPIQPVYETSAQHFRVRAALVLEEARVALSQPLERIWNRSYGRINPMGKNSLVLTSYLSDQKNNFGHPVLIFKSDKPFTQEELFHIRPGSVFQCIPRDSDDRSIRSMCLGVVLSNSRENVLKDKRFLCQIFREADLPSIIDETEWVLAPLSHLISELRAFEAMTVQPGNVPFLMDLIGKQRAQHLRFDEDGIIDDNSEVEVVYPNRPLNANPKLSTECKEIFKLPTLNKVQEQATRSFLEAENGTITIVQGPPGTGKTTLLVNVICRSLLKYQTSDATNHHRLMVCAPTNKAISVLAARFMAAFQQHSIGTFNALIVGDAEKLLSDERSKGSTKSDTQENNGHLKSIFLYTWKQTMVEDYKKIKTCLTPGYNGSSNYRSLYLLSTQLAKRLSNSLPYLSSSLCKTAFEISTAIHDIKPGSSTRAVLDKIDSLVKEIDEIPQDMIWSQLTMFADVIFCTLSSAGGAVLKKTSEIHDLIIDEAAAATEPELCIPFHLKPSRLLIVGDPLQLPATVVSRRATELGLTKSLHERLMYDCKFAYTMLEVQYRMNPEISHFPSKRFYKSMISNGENVDSVKYQNGPLLLDRRPYTFLQVAGREEQGSSLSYLNRSEALKIVELVTELRRVSASTNPSWFSAERIRIITFYQAQVSLIKRLLFDKGLGNKIIVATVDSSQGCEADIVLISFVRSQIDYSKPHIAGFLSDDRRMNVALTRAKYQLICVGNINSFPKMIGAETMQELSSNAAERNIIRHP